MKPEMQALIDRVVIPALLERLLREREELAAAAKPVTRPTPVVEWRPTP